MGLIKNLRLGSDRDRRLIPAAEKLMREVALGAFTTEGQTNEWMLQSSARKWNGCRSCALGGARKSLVYGDGSPVAELLIVGEGPGEVEDETGLTFQGPAGSILRRALESKTVGLDPERYFLTNTVACASLDGERKPRKPDRVEREACQPRLNELCGILRPRAILLLGGAAGLWFGLREVGENLGLVPRAKWPTCSGDGFSRLRAVVLTYHPSAILRAENAVKKRTFFNQHVAGLVLARRAIDTVRREEEASGLRSPS